MRRAATGTGRTWSPWSSRPRPTRRRSRIERMRAYAETRRCRRQFLLVYFGEQTAGLCEDFDNCRFVRDRDGLADAGPFRVEQPVLHPAFGAGVVMGVEGDEGSPCCSTTWVTRRSRCPPSSSRTACWRRCGSCAFDRLRAHARRARRSAHRPSGRDPPCRPGGGRPCPPYHRGWRRSAPQGHGDCRDDAGRGQVALVDGDPRKLQVRQQVELRAGHGAEDRHHDGHDQ